MRMNAPTKAVVAAMAIAGIAVGSLAGAATATAAPAPATAVVQVTDSQAAEQAAEQFAAVNNLGLSTDQARRVQADMQGWGAGTIDGQLGPNSWKAIQRFLQRYYGYDDNIDGIVGPNTIRALQRWMAYWYGYTGDIDGIAGSGTRAAFARYADSLPGA